MPLLESVVKAETLTLLTKSASLTFGATMDELLKLIVTDESVKDTIGLCVVLIPAVGAPTTET